MCGALSDGGFGAIQANTMSDFQQDAPESSEPPTTPTKSVQPHQIALWTSLATLIIGFLIPEVLIPLGYITFGPVEFVLGRFLPWHAWSGFIRVAAALLVLYVEWYIPIKLWAIASRTLRWVLVGYVGLCLATWWGLTAYENRIDWTSRGLNPDRAGFDPQVVVLAGDVSTRRGKANFEIRMRGWDSYYLKQWKGHPPKPRSRTFMQVACHGEGASWGTRHGRFGSKGGGGGIRADETALLVARRLWDGDKFVGVIEGAERAQDDRFAGATEEFSQMFTHGPWLIPGQIEFIRDGRSKEVYRVRRVEFQTEPVEIWFENVKRKHLDYDPELQKVDLGEPPLRNSSQ